nr:uncharacterized protein LOC111513991 [Leptinotarsa decemlineata]
MPNKPNKYGIKIFALCDSKTFYTSNLEVYVGTQPDGPFAQNTSTLSLVDRLCEPIHGSGRNITTDNWFTSIPLAEKLIQRNLTTIGTIRKNKKEIPPEFVQGKNRPIGSSMFGFRKDCTLVSYVPKKKKNVLLISTCHSDDKIDGNSSKPDIIIDYNRTKGGVDVVDKLCASYNTARATRRWQMVIFYSLLNLSGINSQVIFCANKPQSRVVRRQFLENLALCLIEPHLKIRAMSQNLPRPLRVRICHICKLEVAEANRNTENIFGRCFNCSSKKNRRTKYRCQDCNKFLCLEHVTIFCMECSSQEEAKD